MGQPGIGAWGNWGDVSQKGQTFSYKMKKFWGSFAHTAVHNSALYTRTLLRVDHECSHHTHTKGDYEVTDVLINLSVVIVSKCIYILNHHIV